MRAREMEAKYFNWCLNNGLKIYPIPDGKYHYKIVVSKLKKKRWKAKTGKKRYPKKPNKKEIKWWEEIDKLYQHYYHIRTDLEYKEEFKKQTE
ncbi:hypothetical protein [Aquimarina longa]|uniref:hypothetical protein n=1 Tax=Aquimarina longa TaxID=1080221 RepID=UPI00078480A0|nr:hypothetical protein [Aquimarina longa]